MSVSAARTFGQFEARIIMHPASRRFKRIYSEDRIAIGSKTGTRFINTYDIFYCQADSNYCFIMLRTGERVMVSKTLKWVASKLPRTFIRVHASYLVNLEAIVSVRNNMVELECGTTIPLSRSRSKEVRDHLLGAGIYQ